MLIHHLPAEPAYLRVKVRRRLERIGAIPVKSSVYALPDSDEGLEDLSWLLQEITRGGGEGALARATFVDGATHPRLVADCREARDAEYKEIVRNASDLLDEAGRAGAPSADAGRRAGRIAQRLDEVKRVDFFGADGRAAAERAVDDAVRAATGGSRGSGADAAARDVGAGRLWVTRRGVKVDRIASAWLIRRFIDPDARFAFVDPEAYEPELGALRFDMFEGEFTHVGDACTFETLLDAFALGDPSLRALGEIVHDLDCKDDRFGRPECVGVASLVDGIVQSHSEDPARLERGAELLDALLAHFRSRVA